LIRSRLPLQTWNPTQIDKLISHGVAVVAHYAQEAPLRRRAIEITFHNDDEAILPLIGIPAGKDYQGRLQHDLDVEAQ
jgi:hypothetical protein